MEVPGFERKKHENFFNYTDDQLAEKQLALKTMKELWPNTPTYYAELVYDMCLNSTKEEIDKIKEKIETTPFKYSKKEINEKN
jgi:hypothetical protein